MLPVSPDTDLQYLRRLPVRPAPEQWESFTGYLTRLGAENGITRAHALFKSVGLSKELLHRPSECPPLSWGELPFKAKCSESELLATTLHYLGEKFGRSPRVGSTSRFLSGVLSPYVRYCPLCLAQRPWYLLPWRFLTLEGCPTHQCMLLAACGHCGVNIAPLAFRPGVRMTFPPRVHICPSCGCDLSTCASPPISEWQLSSAAQHMADLEFLLAPAHEPFEVRFSPVMLGGWLVQRRRAMGLRQEGIAQLLDTRVGVIGAIERGDVQIGPSFDMYLGYCRCLGITLREAFIASVAPLANEAAEPNLQTGQSTVISAAHAKQAAQEITVEAAALEAEELALRSVLQAITRLREQDVPVTQAAVLEMAGLKRWNLERYPGVREVLRKLQEERQRIEEQRYQEREDDLARRVEAAVIELRSQDKPVSQNGVSRLVGVSLSRLNYYPKVRSMLRGASEGEGGVGPGRNGKGTGVPKGLGEADMLIQVQRAVESLRGRGKPVTLRAVTRWVNVPARKLREYVGVQKLLDRLLSERQADRKKSIEAQRAAREEVLLSRVLDAIEELHREGAPANQLAVSDKVGVSTPTLLYYPRVRAVLEGLEEERLGAIESNRLSKEDLLVARVEDAIAQISESGRTVTQKAIEEWVGMSVTGLNEYARVRAILQDLKPHVKRERARQAAYRKRVLISCTLRAVAALERRGEKVTYRAIEQAVGRVTSSLKRYPQIRSAVEGSPNNPRNRKDRAVGRQSAA
jgi:transcriptional regulator with XRE-family HTH domain